MLSIFLVSCSSQNSETNQEKEKYQTTVQAQLDAFSKKIDALSAEAEKMGATVATQLSQSVDGLKIQDKTINEQLDKLNKAGTESWKELKPSIDQAMDKLEQDYQQVHQQVAEARVNQLDDQIKELRVKAEETGMELSPELAKTIRELETQRQNTGEQLAQLTDASTAAWEDIQAGLETVLANLEKAYQQALTRFEETS